MPGKRIGYIRVSTIDQNPDRQLEKIPLDKKFVDYASGKSIERPSLKNLLEFVREDDIVIVHSMDRLARNLKELKDLVDTFIAQGVEIQFVKENLTFNGENSPFNMLMLHLMGAFAEFELAFIKERQREGIALARKNGKYKGGARKLNGDKILALKTDLTTTRKTKSQIAKDLGISRKTLYEYMKII